MADITPVANMIDVLESASEDALTAFTQAQEAPVESPTVTPPVPAADPEEDDDSLPPTETPPDGEDEDEDDEGEPALAPEGYVSVPIVTDALATEFVLRDAEGELEVPALTIEYKANGKVRRDRLDQVVKMAQYGVYNVEREQTLRAREEKLGQGSNETKTLLQTREAQLENLLADPDLYEEARERYVRANEPDQQVARLQAQLRDRDTATNKERTSLAAQSFLTQVVVPALETIAKHLPEVTVDELQQQLAVGLYHFMENGVVPVSRHGDIRRYIVEHLTEWARTTHDHRVSRFSSVRKDADGKVQKAQVQAQQAKNTMSRAARPAGRAAPDRGQKRAAKVNPSLDEALEDSMTEIMAGVRTALG